MKSRKEIRRKRDELFAFREQGRQSALLSNKEIDAQIMVLNWVLEESKQYDVMKRVNQNEE